MSYKLDVENDIKYLKKFWNNERNRSINNRVNLLKIINNFISSISFLVQLGYHYSCHNCEECNSVKELQWNI